MTKKSLAETHPDIAKQWHPIKNYELTVFDVTPGSNKKVWWKCPKGDDHEWKALINNRNKGRGCPFCSTAPAETAAMRAATAVNFILILIIIYYSFSIL